jgi:hypothetical protein
MHASYPGCCDKKQEQEFPKTVFIGNYCDKKAQVYLKTWA